MTIHKQHRPTNRYCWAAFLLRQCVQKRARGWFAPFPPGTSSVPGLRNRQGGPALEEFWPSRNALTLPLPPTTLQPRDRST